MRLESHEWAGPTVKFDVIDCCYAWDTRYFKREAWLRARTMSNCRIWLRLFLPASKVLFRVISTVGELHLISRPFDREVQSILSEVYVEDHEC